jgi:hypothetical protein
LGIIPTHALLRLLSKFTHLLYNVFQNQAPISSCLSVKGLSSNAFLFLASSIASLISSFVYQFSNALLALGISSFVRVFRKDVSVQ